MWQKKYKGCGDGQQVMVEWYDARFYQGTYSEDSIKEHKMAIFNSLGYLIQKDAITTIIGAEKNNEGEYRDITLIPTGSIISIRKLITKSLV